MKVKTEMKNTSLKIVLTEKREIKINGKPMANCSYQEIKSEAGKHGQVIGKTLPELKAQIIKGQRGAGNSESDNTASGVIVKEKFESKKVLKDTDGKKQEQKAIPAAGSETIIKSDMPYTVKIFLLHSKHGMDAKQATEALGLKGSTAYGKKAIEAHRTSEKLRNKAAKYLKA